MSESIKVESPHKPAKCSVDNCESRFQEGIIMHVLPKCEFVRKQWIAWLNQCNEVIENRKKVFICEKHFKKDDYIPNHNPNSKKMLKRIAVPSMYKIKFTPTILKRTSPTKSLPMELLAEEVVTDQKTELQVDVESAELQEHLISIEDLPPDDKAVAINLEDCEECYRALDTSVDNTNYASCELSTKVNVESDEYKELDEQEARLVDQVSKKKSFNLMNLLRNDEDLITFTGLDFALLDSLTAAVKECEDEVNSKKFSDSVRDRIVLCFCKLKLNLPFHCLAILFGMTQQTCKNYFIYMLELLAAVLEDFIHWPTHDEILNSVPKCFYKYKNTYAVLDCTEIPVEKPRCLKCRLRLYSNYKGCETTKLLIGTTPCGAISYISEAFGGRASNKAIFNYSGLLERLEPTRDAIMVDKGFDIEFECMSNHIKMIMPPKLKNKSQFSREESQETNDIAAARIHIERSIQCFKMFKLVKHKITWTLVPYIDMITRVVAAIVNLKSPLLPDPDD